MLEMDTFVFVLSYISIIVGRFHIRDIFSDGIISPGFGFYCLINGFTS